MESLDAVLAGGGPLLLDFDGPLCGIFAQGRARSIAVELRTLLDDLDVALPEVVASENDPLALLRWTAGLGRESLTVAVDDALSAAELHAASTALPTPYAAEVLAAARQAKRQMAIVSNNSMPAITLYLDQHGLGPFFADIVGRPYGQPERMKPNPELILATARRLEAEPLTCVFVGDSTSDVEGSRSAGMPVIGYANKPGKARRLEDAGADVIITSMGELAAALRAPDMRSKVSPLSPVSPTRP